ncbi:MAG: LysE family transporter [Gammaproteobacteria bacterium]|nr:LysE family transporter [Gammaproteobacteria bacterium]
MSFVTYFIVGTVVCFAGTLPFGPINLAVVKVTVDKNHLRGFEVALAASVVEIFQALIAVWFGMAISRFLDGNTVFKFLVAGAFLLLAAIIWTRKPSEYKAGADDLAGSGIKTGLLVAILNPQVIPFWIFALAAINQYTTLHYEGANLAGFLAGVFLGKLLALSGFVAVSRYLKAHLQQSSQIVNRLLAIVLCFIGVTQLARIVLA